MDLPNFTNMNKILFIKTLLFFCFFSNVNGQMDNQKLNAIIYTLSDEVEGDNGSWQFLIDSTIFICLTDQVNNRMRIITPIDKIENVSDEIMKNCMEANFHSALDVKYATSDGIIWSVFIHPLKELEKNQVIDAISQVFSAAKTYGSTYSSGALSFPSSKDEDVYRN